MGDGAWISCHQVLVTALLSTTLLFSPSSQFDILKKNYIKKRKKKSLLVLAPRALPLTWKYLPWGFFQHCLHECSMLMKIH